VPQKVMHMRYDHMYWNSQSFVNYMGAGGSVGGVSSHRGGVKEEEEEEEEEGEMDMFESGSHYT
jgi:hypothetical protein